MAIAFATFCRLIFYFVLMCFKYWFTRWCMQKVHGIYFLEYCLTIWNQAFHLSIVFLPAVGFFF